jgi:hypothetical protein
MLSSDDERLSHLSICTTRARTQATKALEEVRRKRRVRFSSSLHTSQSKGDCGCEMDCECGPGSVKVIIIGTYKGNCEHKREREYR